MGVCSHLAADGESEGMWVCPQSPIGTPTIPYREHNRNPGPRASRPSSPTVGARGKCSILTALFGNNSSSSLHPSRAHTPPGLLPPSSPRHLPTAHLLGDANGLPPAPPPNSIFGIQPGRRRTPHSFMSHVPFIVHVRLMFCSCRRRFSITYVEITNPSHSPPSRGRRPLRSRHTDLRPAP